LTRTKRLNDPILLGWQRNMAKHLHTGSNTLELTAWPSRDSKIHTRGMYSGEYPIIRLPTWSWRYETSRLIEWKFADSILGLIW
jgi:hypothetical protein